MSSKAITRGDLSPDAKQYLNSPFKQNPYKQAKLY